MWMIAPLLLRIGAHDRALMLRCAISPAPRPFSRAGWTAITHLGGATVSIGAAALPAFACCALREASHLALLTLVLSHLAVQLVKRTIGRGRPPAGGDCARVIHEPDRFSFPSGHAASAMSVALAYGTAFPLWSGPLFLIAMVVGFSRVRLAVHYPSDVLAGQLIALATGAGLILLS
jgi:undecaprenyl-diphosphatase